MAQPENVTNLSASLDEIQQGWHELNSRVGQLEAERNALEHENKSLRFLLERVIEHRQKSHAELVLLLTSLVSKLPINDVGVVVSRLVEHNTHVSEICAALAKGKAEVALPQPTVLKALDQTRRDLLAAVKPAVDELIHLEVPLENEMLLSLTRQPELFFAPQFVRANRCFIKGLVPRERILREYGEAALVFFNDMTTDAKLNPRPKPEEIALAFKSEFDQLVRQQSAALGEKAESLLALHQKVQRSKAATEQTRAQRNVFTRLSFILELLHYYENQSTEAPDVIFAQRLPALVEQLVISGPQDSLDDKFIQQAENLLAFVINPDHRLMIINNIGKVSATGKTLKFVLLLRSDRVPEPDPIIAEFVKHLVPARKAPKLDSLAAVLRLVKPEMQRRFAVAVMDSERLSPGESESFGRALAKELGLSALGTPKKTPENLPVEVERQNAWDKIKYLIGRRAEPAAIASAIRDRLHAKYDSDEVKQSWITLTEADPISLIRVFCLLPYLPDGKTDPVARAVMESYATRLTHEKYAATYHKIVNSLRSTYQANPNSPTLANFMALVKWVDTEAAAKLGKDIGMHAVA